MSCGMRGSSITFFMPASRASFEGHSIQEKTTVSSSLRFTAIGKEVTLPSGTSSPQHSTQRSRAVLLEDRQRLLGVLAVGLAVGGRDRHDESIDVAHDACLPFGSVRRAM